MFLNVTRAGLFKALPYENISNALSKRFPRVTLRPSKYRVGYHTVNSKNFLRKNAAHCSLTGRLSTDSSTTYSTEQELSVVEFEKISDETIDSLTEYFDEIVEQAAHLPDADVSYGDGVLTVKFGEPYGTYVINRQTPNKQIWLSSPKSGPKRYDFVKGKWIYKHDGKSIHDLLNDEISVIIRTPACFDKCSFSGNEKQTATNSLEF